MRDRRPATSSEPVHEYENVDDFVAAGDIPQGRFVIPHEGIPVDFFYEPVNDARTTLVFFHGAATGKVSLPWHLGKSISAGLGANRLAISDPTLSLDDSEKLTLSWFAGSSRQPKLQWFIESVIRSLRDITGAEHLVFVGGSGGGFAALEMSRRFSGSVVLAMNPQTILSKYLKYAVDRYLNTSWDGVSSLDEVSPFVTHDLVEAYPNELNNTIAYVQNTRDSFHIEDHQKPFIDKVGEDTKVFMLMDAWGDPEGTGHVVPPHSLVRDVVRHLVQADGDWGSALNSLGFSNDTSSETIDQLISDAQVTTG